MIHETKTGPATVSFPGKKRTVSNSMILLSFARDTNIVQNDGKFYSANGTVYLSREGVIVPSAFSVVGSEISIYPLDEPEKPYDLIFEPVSCMVPEILVPMTAVLCTVVFILYVIITL